MQLSDLGEIPEEYVGKLAKLKVALQGIMTQDAASNLQYNRSSVRAFDNHLMGGNQDTGDEGMMIIGDDVKINVPDQQPKQSSFLKNLLGAALALGLLGAGAGAAFWGYSQLQDDQVTTNTTIENTEGFLLEFPE